MIAYEEFSYGMSTNYKLTNARTIKQTLLQPSLDTLTGLTLNKNEDTKDVTLHFPTEDVITVTRLTRPEDEYSRDGVDNHTIIIKINDYLELYPPINAVAPLLKKV
jgi:hypothetical protein